jgi:tetratricopeptide (TPR) repeat protein
MNNLGVYQAALGQTREALTLAQDAAAITQQLAQASHGFIPDLATALTNLATRLAEAGRPHEALRPAEEAVTIWRQLAASFPGRYLPDLADGLGNTASLLSELGRHHAADTYRREHDRIRARLRAEGQSS